MKSLFISIFALFIISSCGNNNNRNHRQIPQKMAEEFDKTNHTLQETNNYVVKNTGQLYDSVAKRYPEKNLKELKDAVFGMITYIRDLKKRFLIACGDTQGESLSVENEADTRLTNDFFFNRKHNEILFFKIDSLKDVFYNNTTSRELNGKITDIVILPLSNDKRDYLKEYFYNAPPVAVLTMLSKFENDIKTIENKILQDYLKK